MRTVRAAPAVGVILAPLVAAIIPVGTALAEGMTFVSSRNPSTVGQKVTFTAVFPLTCADGANVSFTVDGATFSPDTMENRTGIKVTATLARVFRTPGTHVVVVSYTAGVPPDPVCGDSSRLTQTVKAMPPRPSVQPPATAPSPAPKASPKPTPAAVPSPRPTPSGSVSSPRLNLDSERMGPTAGDGVPLAALAGLLVAVLAVSYLRWRRHG